MPSRDPAALISIAGGSIRQKQRSPNGAGARVISFIDNVLGHGQADFEATTEDGYRRVAYLSQLAQSEEVRE